jgi:AraC family transcriptional regulator of adaptative response/methylated-DNA-[protein]-cysteine methyltransferase
MKDHKYLVSSHFETPIGTMTIIADTAAIHLIQFTDSEHLSRKIKILLQRTQTTLQGGTTPMTNLVVSELEHYFHGTLTEFRTPIAYAGSPFSLHTWQALQQIPYQQTCSYASLATAIGKTYAWRSVARANAANPLAIIVPCHRVINANGNLGGYNGGIERKQWLIDHEKSNRYYTLNL